MADPGDPKSVWSTVAVIVGTEAAGVIVAGLLHDPQPAALIQALPAGTTVEPDAMFPPLTFDTSATAYGRIVLGGAVGDVSVMLSTSDQPAGPCFAGYVDERRTLSDGTVVDVTSGQNGSRVEVYATDGSHVDVSADRVLTVQQETDIAMTPGLRNN
ncbi:hypothetical protein BH92_01280 [Rhodococcoides fascians A21d2]|uniref:hypothetical protein n=1 Tax=Rhodococcoides fascians TaxID=1828 RepID=UPI00068948FC|nr:hypothetical protein [Rhodococcus fascians]QIH98682.1 hypothetical protein BH92_01280 [Rhodococcus fascians A21d2]